jgi:hypothetical protein
VVPSPSSQPSQPKPGGVVCISCTSAKHGASLALFVGIGAQVGGLLLHALTGQPGHGSIGTVFTVAGAALIGTPPDRFGVWVRTPRLIIDDKG